MEELKKTLECPICGVEKQFLGTHLRRIHGILPDEAKERFGLESLTSPALLASRTGSNNSFFGKHHSDVSKEQMIMKRDGKHFKKFGFECLVIWNREFKDLETLKQRIIEFHNQKRFNEHNQNISNEMVVCSDLHSDMEKAAEMTASVSGIQKGNRYE